MRKNCAISPNEQPIALSDDELDAFTGGGRIACIMGLGGGVLFVISTFATAGIGAAAGTLAEWGIICGCSNYIDGWFGTHFTGSAFCG